MPTCSMANACDSHLVRKRFSSDLSLGEPPELFWSKVSQYESRRQVLSRKTKKSLVALPLRLIVIE